MDIKTIKIDGQLIRVAIREGTSVGTPLLFLNGIGASMELVLPFLESLPPELEVIAFDVPGIGGSSIPDSSYSMYALSTVVVQILDALNYEKVDVLGLSWGGFLAQQFAHSFPKRCRKLILAATSHGMYSLAPSFRVLGLMSSPKRYTDPEYAAKIAPDIYGGSFRYDKNLAASHAKKMIANSNPSGDNKGYNYQLLALVGWSSMHWLSNIQQPTLILAGNDDPIIPIVNMHVVANMIPNSEMRIFDDGHLFLLTDAPKTIPIIQNFLS